MQNCMVKIFLICFSESEVLEVLVGTFLTNQIPLELYCVSFHHVHNVGSWFSKIKNILKNKVLKFLSVYIAAL